MDYLKKDKIKAVLKIYKVTKSRIIFKNEPKKVVNLLFFLIPRLIINNFIIIKQLINP